MTTFLKKLAIAIVRLACGVIVVAIMGVGLPTPIHLKESALFGKVLKDSLLLENSEEPRLILVGGSNVSYGVISPALEKALGRQVINCGIQHDLGLVYMLASVKPFVNSEDIVVVIPEYENYEREFALGGTSTLISLIDVDCMRNIGRLTPEQGIHLLSSLPDYVLKKLNPFRYVARPGGVHALNAFNEYGDAVKHYDLDQTDFISNFHSGLNDAKEISIQELRDFRDFALSKNASCYVGFPSICKTASREGEPFIEKVYHELQKEELQVLGTPGDYTFEDSLFYNSQYHLTKQGAEMRTERVGRDLLEALSN